ncbi:hypothetical protein [Nocardia nepalensis]|uniref:hypothetical protein n=1 Tax=Nocardia nepalensis TaxID=3375448 RepID=UPI003B682CEE
MPGYRSGGGRGAADAIAAAALALAAILYLVRRIWVYLQFDKFYWTDVILIITILLALTATILLLTTSKPATARVAGGITAGMMLAPNISYVFSAFDRIRGLHSAWQTVVGCRSQRRSSRSSRSARCLWQRPAWDRSTPQEPPPSPRSRGPSHRWANHPSSTPASTSRYRRSEPFCGVVWSRDPRRCASDSRLIDNPEHSIDTIRAVARALKLDVRDDETTLTSADTGEAHRRGCRGVVPTDPAQRLVDSHRDCPGQVGRQLVIGARILCPGVEGKALAEAVRPGR